MRILLIVADNEGFIAPFPLGLGYIAAVLRNAGHEVSIYNRDVYHWPDEHLTKYLDEHNFDLIGAGTCGGYRQYREIKRIAKAVRCSRGGAKACAWRTSSYSRARVFHGSHGCRLYCHGRGRTDGFGFG